MKRIKFMEDYGCWALWHMDYEIDGEMGNIDPQSLPISKQLIDKLNQWSALYDATLDQDYPPDSGFQEIIEAENFLKTGHNLVDLLQTELGSSYLIVSTLGINPNKYLSSKLP